MNKNLLYFIMLLLTNHSWLFAQPEIRGEATFTLGQAWDSEGSPLNQTGLRYIPTWSAGQPQSHRYRLDTEIAANFNIYKNSDESGFSLKSNWARFHRGWVRLTTDRFEARLGLQKITFGSARLFRPLAWFDTIDPRDPQKYTAGVTGLRLRYDFPNNAGIWLWGVSSENSLIVIDKDKLSPDIGGRLVYPLGPGEIAFAYNHSFVEINGDFAETGEYSIDIIEDDTEFNVHHYGIEGIWDIGVGLWFEMGVSNIDLIGFPDWHSQLTIGTDYTFSVGNGLTITGEYYIVDRSDERMFADDWSRTDLYGLMGNYPISIMDNLSIFSVYYPDDDFLYNLVHLQRIYDNWLVQVGIYFFSGDDSPTLGSAMSTVGNKGFQLTLVYNH